MTLVRDQKITLMRDEKIYGQATLVRNQTFQLIKYSPGLYVYLTRSSVPISNIYCHRLKILKGTILSMINKKKKKDK